MFQKHHNIHSLVRNLTDTKLYEQCYHTLYLYDAEPFSIVLSLMIGHLIEFHRRPYALIKDTNHHKNYANNYFKITITFLNHYTLFQGYA